MMTVHVHDCAPAQKSDNVVPTQAHTDAMDLSALRMTYGDHCEEVGVLNESNEKI